MHRASSLCRVEPLSLPSWWPTCCQWPEPITSSPWTYTRRRYRASSTYPLTIFMLSQQFWSGSGRTFLIGRRVLWCHPTLGVQKGQPSIFLVHRAWIMIKKSMIFLYHRVTSIADRLNIGFALIHKEASLTVLSCFIILYFFSLPPSLSLSLFLSSSLSPSEEEGEWGGHYGAGGRCNWSGGHHCRWHRWHLRHTLQSKYKVSVLSLQRELCLWRAVAPTEKSTKISYFELLSCYLEKK